MAGGDTVFTVEDHGMRDVDHEDGGCLGLEVHLVDLKVVLVHGELVYAMVDKGVHQ